MGCCALTDPSVGGNVALNVFCSAQISYAFTSIFALMVLFFSLFQYHFRGFNVAILFMRTSLSQFFIPLRKCILSSIKPLDFSTMERTRKDVIVILRSTRTLNKPFSVQITMGNVPLAKSMRGEWSKAYRCCPRLIFIYFNQALTLNSL